MADFVPAFSEKDLPARTSVPWPAIAASVTAIFMLSITARDVMPLILAGCVLCATGLLCSKPELANLSKWIVRPLILIATFVRLVSAGFRFDSDWLLDPFLLSGVGIFLCGELAFQAARPRESGKGSVPSLVMISALIVICGAFTREIRFVPFLTPLYFIFLLLTLIRFSAEDRVQAAPSRRPKYWRLALLGFLALAQGMLFYGSLFIYRSEITNAFLSLMMNMERRSETGLPDVPYLRSTSEMTQSRKRVFKVKGAVKEPHFRAISYNSYSGGTWRPQPATRTMVPIELPKLNPKAKGERLRVERYADRTGMLYAPLHTAGIAPDQAVQLQYPQSAYLSGPLQLATSSHEENIYDIILSADGEHQGLFCHPRRGILSAPEGLSPELLKVHFDPLVNNLGQQITQGLTDPREKIRAVIRYLNENHRYNLSIEVPYPIQGDEQTDPVSVFLLKKKDGFCEYFASAAVLLLRSCGVPSRYVQGYYVHETPSPNNFVVRARDAHAWCESWVDGVGWVVVEATPPSGTPDATSNPGALERASEWLAEKWEEFKDWMAGGGWKTVFFGGVTLLLLVGVLRFWQDWRKRARQAAGVRFDYNSPDELFLEFRKRFEKVLGTRAAACPPSRTWDEHLAALARERGPKVQLDLERAREFVRVYNAARFKQGGPEAELRALDGLLLDLETKK